MLKASSAAPLTACCDVVAGAMGWDLKKLREEGSDTGGYFISGTAILKRPYAPPNGRFRLYEKPLSMEKTGWTHPRQCDTPRQLERIMLN